MSNDYYNVEMMCEECLGALITAENAQCACTERFLNPNYNLMTYSAMLKYADQLMNDGKWHYIFQNDPLNGDHLDAIGQHQYQIISNILKQLTKLDRLSLWNKYSDKILAGFIGLDN